MKYYDNNKESPYLKNCDFNNIYRWAMSQKLPVNGFIGLKISQFNENFTKITNEESDGCFLEVDFQYREKLHNLQNDLPFLPERMKTGKLIANLHNKKGICYSHKKFKTTLNHGLILKKKTTHRVIKFNQNDSLKSYIVMNTNLRKNTKNDFGKDFFKLMNNIVFGKTTVRLKKHRDIKLVTT